MQMGPAAGMLCHKTWISDPALPSLARPRPCLAPAIA